MVRCKMKKITMTWCEPLAKIVKLCEDDFVEIIKRQMVDDATKIGAYAPPDTVVVEDYNMGVANKC